MYYPLETIYSFRQKVFVLVERFYTEACKVDMLFSVGVSSECVPFLFGHRLWIFIFETLIDRQL